MQLKSRFEQLRQAKSIHGGVMKMWAAAMGVRLSRVPIPNRRLREHIFRSVYGGKYAGLEEDELERPLGDFRSLNEVFTRGVRSSSRPVCQDPSTILCPCDSKVQDFGNLEHDTLLTAKGISYSLSSLLPGINSENLAEGSYAILFLSPTDCHRVYCPTDATLREMMHVPGRRLLVHPPYQRKEFPVFTLNERTILCLDTKWGRCILVLVAGWGVGNITHPFPVQLKHSNSRITRASGESLQFSRGDWLATFELGSTVIMLLGPHRGLITNLGFDQRMHFGQPAYSIPSISRISGSIPPSRDT